MGMEYLLWHGNQPKLNAVDREEKWVDDINKTIGDRLDKALVPMKALHHLFQRYVQTLNTNIDEYVQEWIEDEPSIEEAKSEIAAQNELRAKLDELIPKKVWLGLVMVNCEDIRNKLLQHYSTIVK